MTALPCQPLGWEHINLTGDYNWRQNKQVEQGDFRPLPPLNRPERTILPVSWRGPLLASGRSGNALDEIPRHRPRLDELLSASEPIGQCRLEPAALRVVREAVVRLLNVGQGRHGAGQVQSTSSNGL